MLEQRVTKISFGIRIIDDILIYSEKKADAPSQVFCPLVTVPTGDTTAISRFLRRFDRSSPLAPSPVSEEEGIRRSGGGSVLVC
jgi:hypothetical protein